VVQPSAEIEIDEAMVRALLTEQHPDLTDLPLQRMTAGWDNELWRLGDTLIVRLPRRRAAVALTLNEQRWLPVIAGALPLPVPTPLRSGRPGARFPWPWSVVPFLSGGPGDRIPLSVRDASTRLAAFLRALHTPAPVGAPFNAFRGSASLRSRADTFERLLAAVAGEVDPHRLRAVWDAGAAAPGPEGPPVWLHADLHPANILVEHGNLVAVIDFGDMCAGDRANDLASAWMLLPDDGVRTFFDQYGPVDVHTELRARAWAVLISMMLLDVGLAGQRGRRGGKATWAAPARASLGRLVDA